MQPKAARPIPPAHEARAAELRGKGFNVWAKEDGSLGWGKPRAKAPPQPAAAPPSAPAAETPPTEQRAPQRPEKPAAEGSAVGGVLAVLVAVAGLALAGVAAWRRFRSTT